MKSFLVKGKKPIIKWGKLPNEIYYEGEIPYGYSLAVSPWGYDGYIIVDIDNHGKICGFDNIPEHLKDELYSTLHYVTKNNGMHCWLKYSGKKHLANKSSNQGIDLRTNKGYVVWYHNKDIRECIGDIRETSEEMNAWLEKLFGYNKIKI